VNCNSRTKVKRVSRVTSQHVLYISCSRHGRRVCRSFKGRTLAICSKDFKSAFCDSILQDSSRSDCMVRLVQLARVRRRGFEGHVSVTRSSVARALHTEPFRSVSDRKSTETRDSTEFSFFGKQSLIGRFWTGKSCVSVDKFKKVNLFVCRYLGFRSPSRTVQNWLTNDSSHGLTAFKSHTEFVRSKCRRQTILDDEADVEQEDACSLRFFLICFFS
jgi:hypothetical protein